MNYSLHQLKIFLKVIETESITKAADELHLSQPAVSIQLKNLQDQFDIPLTEVIGRKLYITDFGREIAIHAQEILDQMTAIQYKTAAYKGHLTGKLRLAVVSTGKYIIPYFLSDFIANNSSIEVEMDVTNKSKVIERLENNSIDMALVSIVPGTLKTEGLSLLHNKLFLVSSAHHSLTQQQLTKPSLKSLPLIFRENGSGTRQMMEHFLEKKNVNNTPKLELVSNEAVKQAVLAGLGFSIMPLIGIRNELLSKQLSIIPMKGLPLKTEWRLIWMTGKKHTMVSKAFLDHVKNNKETIVTKYFSWYDQY